MISRLNSLLLSFVVALLSSSSLSADIVGKGVAPKHLEAKLNAMSDLSHGIKSEIEARFESRVTTKGEDVQKSSFSDILLLSDLPILGAELEFFHLGSLIEATATLTPKKVAHLYLHELNKIKKSITKLQNRVQNSSSSLARLNLYNKMHSLIKKYERYESVAIALDIELPKGLNITKEELELQISQIDSNIDSIALASKILAEHFKKSASSHKKTYIYPPMIQNNTRVAKFGSIFLKELKSNLRSTKTPKEASQILVGEYSIIHNAMVLNYELIRLKTNEVISSKTINIPKTLYKNIEVKPKNIDFDTLLNSGVISSDKLRVSINSSLGKRDLLFRESQEVELFVKLNKKGYFYIVGYTQTDEDRFSYLLELQEGIGDSKFIKFVNADDASRWISLGKFEVGAPFGYETIQVIASNKKINTLPKVHYNRDNGYYTISKDLNKALLQTRAIKKINTKERQISEAVLNFTTAASEF